MIEHSIYGLAYVEHLSYFGIFIAVAFSGYAIPIPEELILILGGFLAAQGISNIYIITIVSVLGAICGDSFIYYLSGHGSRFTEKYHSKVEKTSVGWYIRSMKNHPGITIFFSRFIVGMRFLNPLVSGLLNIPPWIFVTATALSAAIYIPCIIFIGYYFHERIHTVIHIIHSVREGMITAIALGSIILVLLFFRSLVEKRQ